MAVLAIAVIVATVSTSRTRLRSGVEADLGVHPDDVAELAAVGRRLVRERRAERASLLDQRVKLIRARGVPVRGITPTHSDDEWLLRFADGSRLVVQGQRSGDPWYVLRHLLGGTVAVSAHRYVRGDLLITLDAGTRRPEFIALDEG